MDKGKKIYREDVAKALEKHIKFGLNDEGTLFIQVTDCSPQRRGYGEFHGRNIR